MKCNKCRVKKDINEFDINNKNGFYYKRCIKCRQKDIEYAFKNKEKISEQKKEYYLTHKEYIDNRNKKYNSIHKGKINETSKKYQENNKEKIRKYNKTYYANNKENIDKRTKKYYYDNKENLLINSKKYSKEYIKIRRKKDILFAVTLQIRSTINKSLNRFNYAKKSKTQEILGCTFDEFKMYLESKFEPWMCWNNKGLYNGEFNYGWDIDHIIPISSAKTEEDIIKLNHYTNLQPLCSKINRDIKKNSINYENREV